MPKLTQENTTNKTTVTFQNQSVELNQQKTDQESLNSRILNSIITKKNSGFTPNFESILDSTRTTALTTMNPPSSSLLDSLFSSSKPSTSNILNNIDPTISRQKTPLNNITE